MTSAQPTVEFTSPTTTTTSGRTESASGSNAAITRPVCTAWLAEPTWRKWSGWRMPRSAKNTSFMAGS